MGIQAQIRRNTKADYARANGVYFGSLSGVSEGVKRAAKRLKEEAKARDERLSNAAAPTHETRQQARAAVRRILKPAPAPAKRKKK